MRPGEDAGGPFSTSVSRDAADAYIKEKIKDHEEILCYYKGRLNALNLTCRIPREILTKVFNEVAQCSNDRCGKDLVDWIETVSHVRSHWRRVALSSPRLWSNIPMGYSLWAMEMIHRSKTVPLTIKYQDYSGIGQRGRSCMVFKEILHSHRSRIKNLTLELLFIRPPDDDMSGGQDFGGLLNLERLEVKLWPRMPENILPKGLSMSSRLQHLRLEGCAIIWNQDFDFRNLRSLEIIDLSEEISPSVAQLLAILSQTTLLKNLYIMRIQDFSNLGDTALPQNNGLLNLQHLECITVSSDLPTCAVLMDHINFSSNAQKIALLFPAVRESSPFLQPLAQRIDNGIANSILKLKIGANKILCWKSEDTTITPSPKLPPTIDVGNFAYYGHRASFFRSLGLEQLRSLEVTIMLKEDAWLLFGNLPHLTTLRVVSNEIHLLTRLLCGMANVVPNPDTPPRPAFVALRRLTIVSWVLKIIADTANRSIIKILEDCLECRLEKSGQRLDLLRLERCENVDVDDLARLRKFVKKVDSDWIRSGNDFLDDGSVDEASLSAEDTGSYHGSNY